ncbi:type II toxin-antitoxin system HicA family toxin [Thiohalorhabdus methylotrophus]|uniref:Type II toxin-antitoxin system HicA family toxin n=1 Tax=Thiohalorhabdus methylotrophus TaxID=3242694 RepID=A0ABV4TYY3_9GAMM
MGKYAKLRQKILAGGADANVDFADLRTLLRRLGFEERIKGDHHIFTRSDVEEIVNLQPRGSKAKPYQVKQVRNLLVKYRLGETHVD